MFVRSYGTFDYVGLGLHCSHYKVRLKDSFGTPGMHEGGTTSMKNEHPQANDEVCRR